MKRQFTQALAEYDHDPKGRRWVFVPYDQLTDSIGPLSEIAPSEAGVVLVECPAKAAKRPYHKQKLALVLANLRQFALEQARRGVAVRHVVSEGSYADALRPLTKELGPLVCMEPAERELREDLQELVDDGLLGYSEHEGFLTTTAQFEAHRQQAPWRMDAFYRLVRQDSGVLMENGKPEGGKYSFDAHNRESWSGEPEAAEPPRFRHDEVTKEVGELIESEYGDHPGTLDLGTIPASKSQVERLWDWAKESCLPLFGPYEDAMSVHSTNLFHTRVSPLLHLHRLLPREVVSDALEMDLDLPSKEGFVRQILGWREFMRHVHRATDGFRKLPEGLAELVGTETDERGACPNRLGAERPLPDAFWGGCKSGLHCLDTVVETVWDEGYSHHITRLMVLSNLATLLDIEPRALTDWFWVAYTDAYDWVVEPNVLGMGTFAVGELFTTKPYVSGAAYIDKMSDYCGECAFHPKKTCPITRLYWAFLDRHQDALEGNQRIAMPLRSLQKRASEKREEDRQIFEAVSAMLTDGAELTPESLQEAVES